MLPFIVLTAAVIFLILWREGVFNDLSRLGLGRRARRQGSPEKTEGPALDGEMSKRLEVFENFIDQLTGSDEEDEPKN